MKRCTLFYRKHSSGWSAVYSWVDLYPSKNLNLGDLFFDHILPDISGYPRNVFNWSAGVPEYWSGEVWASIAHSLWGTLSATCKAFIAPAPFLYSYTIAPILRIDWIGGTAFSG